MLKTERKLDTQSWWREDAISSVIRKCLFKLVLPSADLRGKSSSHGREGCIQTLVKEQNDSGWEAPFPFESISFVWQRTKCDIPAPSSNVFNVPHQLNVLEEENLTLVFKLQSKGKNSEPSFSPIFPLATVSGESATSVSRLLPVFCCCELLLVSWTVFVDLFSWFSSSPSRALNSLHSEVFSSAERFAFFLGEHLKGFARFNACERPSWIRPLIGFKAFEIRFDEFWVSFFFFIFNFITPEGFLNRISSGECFSSMFKSDNYFPSTLPATKYNGFYKFRAKTSRDIYFASTQASSLRLLKTSHFNQNLFR